MLDTETKRRIDTARDILVGKVPDPKSQVEQITIALIYKFMDDMDLDSEELGGERSFFKGDFEKYTWRRIFDPRMGGFEILNLYAEAIMKMNINPNIPQLFRDIFKNAYLPYRDPETLKAFLKIINDFNYDHSEKLGDAFEYLLSVLGSQGEAGQFRTPRHIIDFMVAVIDPKKEEVILDPACGTAGFLISSYKHVLKNNSSNYNSETDTRTFETKDQSLSEIIINSKNYKGDKLTPDERNRLAISIKGYDISPDMVRLSLANMYLHGLNAPRIVEYDTLTSEDNWNDYADVILANPPFMSPKGGIRPHKRFSISSNRSEVLFVDYIAEHLTPNGRASVIVPEGIIFQSGKAYKSLRKMLVDTYLVGVISLPAGVFQPYSGVKTSILWMDKALAKKTDKILFVKIENDGFDLGAQRRPIKQNDLPDSLIDLVQYRHSLINAKSPENGKLNIVSKQEIIDSGDYNLRGERYRHQTLTSKKFGTSRLGDLVEVLDKFRKPIAKGVRISGEYPYYGATGILDYVHEYIFSERLVLVGEDGAKWGADEKSAFIAEGKYWVNNHAHVLRPKKELLVDTYLVEVLNCMDLLPYITGVTVPKLNQAKLNEIPIPIPPLYVQEEIAAEIESYQKIIDGARQVVENYKPRIDIDPEWEIVELVKVCEIISGYGFDSKDFSKDNQIKCIKITNVGVREFISDTNENLPVDYLTKYSRYTVNKGDLVISLTRSIISTGLKVAKVPDSWDTSLVNQRVAGIKPKESTNIDFVYFYLCSDDVHKYVEEKSRSLMQPNLSITDLKNLPIPFPSKNIQNRIVAKIKKVEESVDSNKELIEIFEQSIKDRISKVWGE